MDEKLQTLALAVENSPVSIIIADAQKKIVYVNPAFERISGYSQDEAVGRNPRFMASGQTAPETYQEMWRTVAAGKTWHGEFINRRKNGELYYQSTAIAPVLNARGETVFYVGVQEDVTLLRRLNEDLKRARKQAEAANSAKTRFLAAASHDLRQPLQAMRLYMDVLAEEVTECGQKELVEKLQAVHVEVSGLLDRLLHISRLDLGKVEAEPEAFDLSMMLHEIHAQYQSIAMDKGLDWRVRSTSVRSMVMADPMLVREILDNLISNAIRYTSDGGVLLSARQRGDRLRIEVWDTGSGIAPDDHERIFQELVQLGNPERDRRKGIGLGLSIASRLAQLLGTRIRLRSRPGKGTVFFFELPLTTKRDTDTHLPTSITPSLGGQLVFVVDDDSRVREALGLLLTRWDCNACCFSGGAQALAAMQDECILPAALIVDYRLADAVCGIDVVRDIRAFAGQEIPALILTGDTDIESTQVALQSGLPLLHKPVKAEKLAQFLTAHLVKFM